MIVRSWIMNVALISFLITTINVVYRVRVQFSHNLKAYRVNQRLV